MLSEQYWVRERDLSADMVRLMDQRGRCQLDGHGDVCAYCHETPVPQSLTFPNVFITVTFAEWRFPSLA